MKINKPLLYIVLVLILIYSAAAVDIIFQNPTAAQSAAQSVIADFNSIPNTYLNEGNLFVAQYHLTSDFKAGTYNLTAAGSVYSETDNDGVSVRGTYFVYKLNDSYTFSYNTSTSTAIRWTGKEANYGALDFDMVFLDENKDIVLIINTGCANINCIEGPAGIKIPDASYSKLINYSIGTGMDFETTWSTDTIILNDSSIDAGGELNFNHNIFTTGQGFKYVLFYFLPSTTQKQISITNFSITNLNLFSENDLPSGSITGSVRTCLNDTGSVAVPLTYNITDPEGDNIYYFLSDKLWTSSLLSVPFDGSCYYSTSFTDFVTSFGVGYLLQLYEGRPSGDIQFCTADTAIIKSLINSTIQSECQFSVDTIYDWPFLTGLVVDYYYVTRTPFLSYALLNYDCDGNRPVYFDTVNMQSGGTRFNMITDWIVKDTDDVDTFQMSFIDTYDYFNYLPTNLSFNSSNGLLKVWVKGVYVYNETFAANTPQLFRVWYKDMDFDNDVYDLIIGVYNTTDGINELIYSNTSIPLNNVQLDHVAYYYTPGSFIDTVVQTSDVVYTNWSTTPPTEIVQYSQTYRPVEIKVSDSYHYTIPEYNTFNVSITVFRDCDLVNKTRADPVTDLDDYDTPPADTEAKGKLSGLIYLLRQLTAASRNEPVFEYIRAAGSIFWLIFFYALFMETKNFLFSLLISSSTVFLYGLIGWTYTAVTVAAAICVVGVLTFYVAKNFIGGNTSE